MIDLFLGFSLINITLNQVFLFVNFQQMYQIDMNKQLHVVLSKIVH